MYHYSQIKVTEKKTAYIMRFAGIHVVFMVELRIAADDCCVSSPDDTLQSLHELTKDCNASFRRQHEWSRSIFSMGSDRLTESHWADAFDGDVVVLLHSADFVSSNEC
jgi:hypothetical protein